MAQWGREIFADGLSLVSSRWWHYYRHSTVSTNLTRNGIAYVKEIQGDKPRPYSYVVAKETRVSSGNLTSLCL